MKILDLFDKYFLIMMIIQGCIVAFFDSKNYINAKAIEASKKAKIVGIGVLVLSLGLFIASKFI